MAKTEGSVILYAVDLAELTAWVGSKDDALFEEAKQLIGSDPDSGWEDELGLVFDRLLRRVVYEGKLYDGLADEDRYYLTQLLIDLFDEYVDSEALTEEMPLERLMESAADLPRDSPASLGMGRLLRGRELGGGGLLWESGDFDAVQPLLGYVTREEAGAFARALEAAMGAASRGGARPPRAGKGRPSGLLKQLVSAARECAETEFDLVSFVG